MDVARREFLTGAGFSGDEDCAGGGSRAIEIALYCASGTVFAHHYVGARIGCRWHETLDGVGQILDAKRGPQVLVRSGPKRGDGEFFAALVNDDYAGQV